MEITSNEVDPINAELPGTYTQFAKTGPSVMPSRLVGQSYGEATFALVQYGHATAGRAEIGDDVVVLALPVEVEGRWDGQPVEQGHPYVYPPGSTHRSHDVAGCSVAVFTIEDGVLRAAMDALGRSSDIQVGQRLVGDDARDWVRIQQALVAPPTIDGALARAVIIDQAARSLASAAPFEHFRAGTGQTDRRIVGRTEDFLLENERWSATMLELCEATGLSDRRVQLAFERVYDLSPMAFMRGRALSAARTALRAASPAVSVSRVALDHGFNHLGRFSQYYRTAYGESPSETLRGRRRG